jgi:hypothetical protein
LSLFRTQCVDAIVELHGDIGRDDSTNSIQATHSLLRFLSVRAVGHIGQGAEPHVMFAPRSCRLLDSGIAASALEKGWAVSSCHRDQARSTSGTFCVKLVASAQFPSARDPGINREVGAVGWTSVLPTPVGNAISSPRGCTSFQQRSIVTIPNRRIGVECPEPQSSG